MTDDSMVRKPDSGLHDRAIRRCVERLWANPAILAVALFGSVEAGAARPESDVDLFVIEEAGDELVWKGVYLREEGLIFHLQYLSKAQLKEAWGGLRGGPFHRAFASARLLAVRDPEVEAIFTEAGEFPADHRELRTLGAAAELCDALYRLEKLASGPGTSAWLPAALRVLENLARIALIGQGRPPGPEPLAEACGLDLDPGLAEAAGALEHPNLETARAIVTLGECRLGANLEAWSRPLTRFLAGWEQPPALDELAEHELFSPLKADFEKLIMRLARDGLIKEGSRPFRPTASAEAVGSEIVYTGGKVRKV